MEEGVQSGDRASGIRLHRDGVSFDRHFTPQISLQIMKKALRLGHRFVWRSVCNGMVVIVP
jgi:hypothetical protein